MTIQQITKVAIYGRQSAGDEQDSTSIASQIETLQEVADNNGWEVVLVAQDANTSGRTYPDNERGRELYAMDSEAQEYLQSKAERKLYRAGLADILAVLDQVDAILLYDDTRLMRPLPTSYLYGYLTSLLKDTDTCCFTVSNGMLDYNQFSTVLMQTINNLTSDNAIKTQLDKAKAVKKQMRLEGKLITNKFVNALGYESAGKGKLKIVEAEAPTVKRIYKDFLTGKSYLQIAGELEAEQAPKRGAGSWSYDIIKRVLTNSAYIGKDDNGNGQLIDVIPAKGLELIDESDWYKVQSILNQSKQTKTRKTKDIYPFSGLLFCGNCGTALRKSRKASYQCGQYKSLPVKLVPKTCQSATIRDTKAYNGVAGIDVIGLREALKPLLYFAVMRDMQASRDKASIKASINKLDNEIQTITKREQDLATAFASGALDVGQLTTFTQPLKTRKTEIQAERAELEAALSTAKVDATEVLDKINNDKITAQEYRNLIHSVVKRIDVFADRIEISLVSGDSLTLPRRKVASSVTLPTPDTDIDYSNPASGYIALAWGFGTEAPTEYGLKL